LTPTETHTDAETQESGVEHTHDHSHEGHTHVHAAAAPKSECEREVTVEVPKDVMEHETEKVVAKYQKLARIPGFRKGKVPANLIRKQFAAEIKQEVVEALIPKYFQEEVKKQNVTPISQPRITDLHAHEGEPLRFTAAFEVMPEVQLGDYRAHGVSAVKIEVGDEEVEREIESLRERQASYENVDEDRPLQDGDYAQISFQGTPKLKEGEEAQPGTTPASMEDVLVEIGGANTVAEFNENLRGAKAGDERTFDVAYAEDFAEPRLAGQTITYAVKVNGIKKKVTPELNDDFAKDLGEFSSLDDLKAKLRDNLQHQKQSSAEAEAKDKVLDYLISQSNFPVPEVFVNQQIDLRLDRGLRALAQQGMRTEDMRKLDLNRLRSGQRDQAIREVKAAMLLDKIADEQNITVTDDEVTNELEALATHTGEDLNALRTRLTRDGALDRIRERMRNEKTLNHLLQS